MSIKKKGKTRKVDISNIYKSPSENPIYRNYTPPKHIYPKGVFIYKRKDEYPLSIVIFLDDFLEWAKNNHAFTEKGGDKKAIPFDVAIIEDTLQPIADSKHYEYVSGRYNVKNSKVRIDKRKSKVKERKK